MAASLSACTGVKTKPPLPMGSLLGQNLALGHRLRTAPSDDEFRGAQILNRDVVIIGGGPAGLSAGYRLQKKGLDSFALLELEKKAGGTSLSGQSPITPYPWGAHYITTPMADNHDLVVLLREMGVVNTDEQTGQVSGRAPYMVTEPKERLYHQGFFYPGLYLQAGASPEDARQRAHFTGLWRGLAATRDGNGRHPFTSPRHLASRDGRWAELNRVSAADWLRSHGLNSKRLLWLLSYACRDDYGLTLADTSAWALLFYFASRYDVERNTSTEVLTWPEGNGALTQELRKNFQEKIHEQCTVLDVVQSATGIEARTVVGAEQRPLIYRARQAIFATPQFITRRIFRDFRDGARPAPDLSTGAWLVANLHLRERPNQRRADQAWDTVLSDSPSLGYVCATHQRGRLTGKTVLTYYLPMTDSNPRSGRKRLFELSLEETQESILSDLERPHPDIRDVTERLDIFRWGHAMVQPRPGDLFSQALSTSALPLGRAHFAHSDLSGLALFEEAFAHGTRAADEVMHAQRTGQ